MKKLIALLCVVTCLASEAQTPVSKHDKEFAVCAAKAGMKEVKLGQLALTNGSSQQIKNLGQQMVDDHSKANAELMELTSKKAITLPSGMTEKEQKGYDKLAKLKGAEFDKAYAKCMVKDHKQAICLFKREAKKGEDSDLKTFAQGKVPTLEHHKMMSEEVCKAVK